MKINKTILVGILFILIGCIIFISDILNPIIRPLTHIFLMGSSKGKDILFFLIIGLFIIISQVFKDKKIDSNKYLKISIILGIILLISGILVEIVFRYGLGIGLNTTFMSVKNGISSTSIIHTHLLKSIFGNLIASVLGPVSGDINTGISLYSYVPAFANIIMILFPILFITLALSIRNRYLPPTILISFFGTCLLIGALDGGLFSTPAMAGICGLFVLFWNEYYFNFYVGVLFKNKKLMSAECKPDYYTKRDNKYKFILNRIFPYIIIFIFIALRISISILGAQPEYYTLEVTNPVDEIEMTGIDVENITINNNTITYIINPHYNEMDLLNRIKVQLNNSCEYYTLSWNIMTYFNKPQ